jgi:hypothetical protein
MSAEVIELSIKHVAAQDVKVGDNAVSPEGWRGRVTVNAVQPDGSYVIRVGGAQGLYSAHDQFTIETEVERKGITVTFDNEEQLAIVKAALEFYANGSDGFYEGGWSDQQGQRAARALEKAA